MERTTNPFAPLAYSGLVGGYPAGYVDVDFTYVYDVTLTANQRLNDQVLPIQNDADFAWRALIVSQFTGSFSVRFADSQGYYLSNALIVHTNFLVGGQPVPFPVSPEIVLPSGGRIGIDILDTSGAGNTVELLFRGVKRYRLPER